jgi:RNA polymerase primary sigma factor
MPARASRRLTPGEVVALVRRAQHGDRRARDRVVTEHMRLVRAVAARYRDLGLPVEDLAQEGAIGLLGAIAAFDPSHGAAFSTFAHLRVRNAVLRALTSAGRPLRLPKTIVERRHVLARASARLSAAGRRASPEALAAETGLDLDDVVEALGAPSAAASLDAPVRDGLTLAEVVPDGTAVDPQAELLADERRRLVSAAIDGLPARRKDVVRSYFGVACEPENLAEIGARLDVSQQRARAIRDDALHDLADELTGATQRGWGSPTRRRRPRKATVQPRGRAPGRSCERAEGGRDRADPLRER